MSQCPVAITTLDAAQLPGPSPPGTRLAARSTASTVVSSSTGARNERA